MVAERVGFEPTVGYKPTPVFKTGAFNHSATSPEPVQNPPDTLETSGKDPTKCGIAYSTPGSQHE